jgi:polysaccharide biosynthesis/export protein
MKNFLLPFLFIAWIVPPLSGCMTAGESVVRITSIQGTALELKPQEKAQLEEIKKSKTASVDPGLAEMIEKTQQYSVGEYLALHPDAVGGPGQDYRVGGYDILNIQVYEEKDLSREAVRVSADGYISFPLVGRIKVADMTPSEIEGLVSRRLAEQQYLLSAHVTVTVADYKSKRYLVLGAVQAPGGHPLQAQERVLDGLSKAMGVAADKAGKNAMVIRTEEQGGVERRIVIKIDLPGFLKGKELASNILLKDKDVLYVPPAEYFYIMGQIRTPGSYPIPDRELTVVEAISVAGGFTPIASRNRTRIIRVEEGVEKIIEVKVDAITREGMKIRDVIIQPNDLIVVPESFF